MRLVVNDVPVEVTAVSPDMTLLRYLREELMLTGTKEGCASGDCGACTVLVSDPEAEEGAYKAVNSCICPLGSVNNQRVTTVEGLADTHPVQNAMVSCHGSQCGFCTPGFVMSLVGLHESRRNPGQVDDPALRHQVLDAISGNLCRCTGYRPIVEAGLQALGKPAQLVNNVAPERLGAPLAGKPVLATGTGGYWQPTTETELQTVLREHPDARFVAGGTDLMLESTQLYRSLPKLVDLNRVASLRRVTIEDDHVWLGAAVTYTQLEQAFEESSPELMSMLARLGSRQIRHWGTVGGNIANASPIADMPPYLLVLGAELVINKSDGTSRVERLSDFYIDYKQTRLYAGEYLAEIVVPRASLHSPLKLFKISKRYEDDISAVMGAFRWGEDEQLTIAYGGMAAIPKRATATEDFINCQRWWLDGGVDEAVLSRACEVLSTEFTPMTDVRASAEYRMAMAGNLLRKACHEFAAEWAGHTIEAGVFSHA